MAIQNYNLVSVNYGNTFQGVRFNLPQQLTYSLTGAIVTMQVRTSPEGAAVATYILPHIDQYSFQLLPFVVKIKPNTYEYDILISFADGREKTYIGGTWTINPVISKK